ncbi:hypothetical protein K6W76_14320 [Burkholderia anthina]|uniref:hypothetical protein n=1 Tax=Burkholderia anthina TaxID=179879 RepID=UPI00158B3E57|nr:hypothetical protein [Burkholderia anthina]MBY4867675.1 hypothetical protein [Burkholderia anthina]
MLRFDGENYVWKGVSVSKIRVDELSDDERFEFFCAIYAHDPADIEMASVHPCENMPSNCG